LEFSQAKLHRLVARPGWSWSSSVTWTPEPASRAATEAPITPAPITTQWRGWFTGSTVRGELRLTDEEFAAVVAVNLVLNVQRPGSRNCREVGE